MIGRKIKIFFIAIMAAGFLFCVGCNNVTKENFEEIELGMDYNEVVTILGATTECSDSLILKKCTWGSEEQFIKITFVIDKVVFRSSNGLDK
jgi:hypothetical protein